MGTLLKDSTKLDIVRRAVIARGCSVTIGDIVSETGLDNETAKSCLNSLISTHEGVMRVSEKGELLYEFSKGCILRDQRSWWERNQKAIYKGIKAVFKVVIFLFLLVYFIIYLCILIALLSQNRNSRSSSGGFDMAIWFFWGRSSRSRSDSYIGSSGEKREPIYTRVYNFMFGPEEPEKDPLEMRTRCAQLIRARNGVITVEDWMMVSGQSREKCESDLARYTAEFEGDAEILENGTLVYVFPDVMKSMKSGNRPQFPKPAWKTLEAPRKLSGNSAGGNAMVIGLNLFNLIMAWACTSIIPQILADQAAQTGQTVSVMGDSTFLWLGLIPLIFSILIFAVPLFRIPAHIKENGRRRKEAVRKSLLSAVFDGNGSAYSSVSRTAAVAAAKKQMGQVYVKEPTSDEFNEAMADLCDELGSTFDPNDPNATYKFPDMEMRLNEAERKRQQLDLKSQDVGRVIFSTNNDEYESIESDNASHDLQDFDRVLMSSQNSSQARNQSRLDDEDSRSAANNRASSSSR